MNIYDSFDATRMRLGFGSNQCAEMQELSLVRVLKNIRLTRVEKEEKMKEIKRSQSAYLDTLVRDAALRWSKNPKDFGRLLCKPCAMENGKSPVLKKALNSQLACLTFEDILALGCCSIFTIYQVSRDRGSNGIRLIREFVEDVELCGNHVAVLDSDCDIHLFWRPLYYCSESIGLNGTLYQINRLVSIQENRNGLREAFMMLAVSDLRHFDQEPNPA